MKNYTCEYIKKYPKQTKRLLGIDYQQLEQLMALGKLIHRKNQSEIEKKLGLINQEAEHLLNCHRRNKLF